MIDTSVLDVAHERIALQFSGGKDSTAVAYLLRPHWDRLTFYHVDNGDFLPEVVEHVDKVAAQVPRFVRIRGDIRRFLDTVALPSDLVPTSGTPLGMAYGMGDQRIVDRFECCATNIMMPMHQRMLADGITLAIRGTKRADMRRIPCGSGDTGLGYYLWLPIEDWSHDEVFAYLAEQGVTLPQLYSRQVNAPECATCPAWWSEKRGSYLEEHYPDLFREYAARLSVVVAAIEPVWATLQGELAHG